MPIRSRQNVRYTPVVDHEPLRIVEFVNRSKHNRYLRFSRIRGCVIRSSTSSRI
jgi:hypothetical protein